MEVEFAGQNLENNGDLADWTHPVDLIEPQEDDAPGRNAEMLAKVMAEVFRGRSLRKLDYSSAFNRFVALAYVVNPQLLDGKSLTALGEEIGVTRAALSAYTTKWSDLLGGYRSGGQKSQAARESYRKAQEGHENYRRTGPQINVRTQERLAQLREDFHAGRTWKQLDRELLRRRGLIGAGDRLTPLGREWVKGCPYPGAPASVTHRG